MALAMMGLPHTAESIPAANADRRRSSVTHGTVSRSRKRAVSALLAAGLASCGIPRDADHTFDHVQNGVMRIGVVDHPPWAHASDSGVVGVEPALVADLARQLHARAEWRRGAESELLQALHERKLDIVVGGLTTDSPWKREVAFTDPYEGGEHPKHVLAVAAGENAWLMRVEQYLEAHGEASVASMSRQ
jgi:polar amino acid transport system substrate-binding protein